MIKAESVNVSLQRHLAALSESFDCLQQESEGDEDKDEWWWQCQWWWWPWWWIQTLLMSSVWSLLQDDKRSQIAIDSAIPDICHRRTDGVCGEKIGHVCNLCGYSTTSASKQKRHMLVHRSKSCLAVRFPEVRNRKGTEGGPVHSGEKPVVHTQCNFSCTTACHLKIHNQIHLGEMSFNCRQCNYACTTAVNLKRHMLTHSRAKPFGCSQCNNTFTTAQNL